MTKDLFFSDDELSGVVPKSAFCWWRKPEEFDENGNFKIEITNLSNLTPRFKVLREMERLAFVASEGLDDLRHKLVCYRPGDFWVPVGGVKKEDMDVPPMITLLLVGLSGSGKSAFVNLLYSVLGRSGVIPFAQTSGESSNNTTMYLEEQNVLRSQRSGFCVFDTRGFDQDRMDEGLEELSSWTVNGVRHNQPCNRGVDVNGKGSGGPMERDSSRYMKRKVNCVLVVADLSLIHKAFASGGDMKSMEALRDIFHSPDIKRSNESPMLILTHGDTLNSEDRLNGRLKICEYLGIPETSGAYDIPCLTQQGILAEECDPVTAFALTEVIYRALLVSDRTHVPKKKFKDWVVSVLSWIMWCFGAFFTMLAHFFAKYGDHDHKLKM